MSMVELKREAKGKPGNGNGKAAQPLAQGEKPPSAKKQAFQDMLANEPVVAEQVRERALVAYAKASGAPEIYEKEAVLREMFIRMAEGESLNSISRDAHMPSRGLVYYWMKDRPDIAENFARAQDSQSHALLDDCLHIADNVQLSGDAAIDAARINRAKMQIDTRLRIIAKANPARYGDRVQHTGANGGPIAVATVTINARDLMPEQRDSLRAMLLAAKGEQNQGLSDSESEE